MNRLTQYFAKTIKQVKDCPDCVQRREAIMANIKVMEDKLLRRNRGGVTTKPIIPVKRG